MSEQQPAQPEKPAQPAQPEHVHGPGCNHEAVDIKNDREIAVAHNVAAIDLFWAKDFPAAIEKYNEAIATYPGESTFHSNKAMSLYANNKKNEALASMRDGLKINPKCINILANQPRIDQDLVMLKIKLDQSDPLLSNKVAALNSQFEGKP